VGFADTNSNAPTFRNLASRAQSCSLAAFLSQPNRLAQLTEDRKSHLLGFVQEEPKAFRSTFPPSSLYLFFCCC
jgi:hypothetical protein